MFRQMTNEEVNHILQSLERTLPSCQLNHGSGKAVDKMVKTVTMHQLNYLPWIGLFSRIAHSDCLVMAGDVQYTTISVINRNKIRTKSG